MEKYPLVRIHKKHSKIKENSKREKTTPTGGNKLPKKDSHPLALDFLAAAVDVRKPVLDWESNQGHLGTWVHP